MVGAVPHARRRDRLLGVGSAGRSATLKRQKSISSQAASISAWIAVFDWPSMVAAFRVARHGPASRSAALRKIAARSSKDSARQPGRGGLGRVDGGPGVVVRSRCAACPSTWWRLCGWTTSIGSPAAEPLLAADGHGQLDAARSAIRLSVRLELGALGAARGVLPDRLVDRRGNLGDGVHGTSWCHAVRTWQPQASRLRRAGRAPAAAYQPSSWSSTASTTKRGVVVAGVGRAAGRPPPGVRRQRRRRRRPGRTRPGASGTGPASRTAARSSSGAGRAGGVGHLGRQHDPAGRRRRRASSRSEARAAAAAAAYSSSSRSPSTYHSRSAGVTA